jgi:hypothetical protein
MPYGVLATSYDLIDHGVISEADVQFSSSIPWGDGSPSSRTYDVQSISSHELGHWLQLLDQYGNADRLKVMYGYGGMEEQRRNPVEGDIAGILWIYPRTTPSPTPTPTLSPTVTPTASPTSSPDEGPVCRVKDAGVRRGAVCTIRYKVSDDVNLLVTRHVSILTRSGAVKKRWTGVTRSSASWRSFRFTCDLRRGEYRIVVDAEDLTGNAASVRGRATLTVK